MIAAPTDDAMVAYIGSPAFRVRSEQVRQEFLDQIERGQDVTPVELARRLGLPITTLCTPLGDALLHLALEIPRSIWGRPN